MTASAGAAVFTALEGLACGNPVEPGYYREGPPFDRYPPAQVDQPADAAADPDADAAPDAGADAP